MNFEVLIRILDIPINLDRNKQKEAIPTGMRGEIYERDNMTCQLCGKTDLENPNIHHIIPNGLASHNNLITLCKHCHDAIHLLLYTSKKWKYCKVWGHNKGFSF